MAHENDLHVMPDAGGWKILVPGNDDPVATTSTQEEAIHLATRMQLDCSERGWGSAHPWA